MFGLDLIALIKTAGYAGLGTIIFAESGLLIGFFLPGDSLLFTAGFLASQGFFNIWLLVLIVVPAAIIGDNFGYAFGRKVGPMIFRREDSILFHKDNLDRARRFYEAHGKKTIILARFMPGIRTFAPILAGVGAMEYRVFFSYNVIGGISWSAGLALAGYYLGNIVPGIDRYILLIVIAIILISMLPTVVHLIRYPEDRRRIVGGIKKKIFSR